MNKKSTTPRWRIWNDTALNIKPHRHKSFRLSRDPNFVPKLLDVGGVYLNPPQKVIVLCVDEEREIQALDRTPAPLGLKEESLRHVDARLRASRHNDSVCRPKLHSHFCERN